MVRLHLSRGNGPVRLLCTSAFAFELCSGRSLRPLLPVPGFLLSRSSPDTRRLRRPGPSFHARHRADADADADADALDLASSSARRDFLLSSAAARAAALAASASSPAKTLAAPSPDEGSSRTGTSAWSAAGPAPFSSRRRYRRLVLRNGLRVILVSDAGAASRCSAALSVEGAGQFADPLPGIAHLMEHMTLSSDVTRRRSGSVGTGEEGAMEDFEDWLADVDGASNAFTGPGSVCFHYGAPPGAFQESLRRFAALFAQKTVERTLKDEQKLRREVRRVDAELDFSSHASKSYYLLKHSMNPLHPFARFSAGNLNTLERDPKDAEIDVATELLDFFKTRYLPERAVLVVIGNADFSSLEKWVIPYFSTVLSTSSYAAGMETSQITYPLPAFQRRSNNKPSLMVLARSRNSNDNIAENMEKLSLEWPLNIQYNSLEEPTGPRLIGAPAIAFVISQILARRGPTSLYNYMLRQDWIPKGTAGLPRITLPIDTSGFQILRLELNLTPVGFVARSAVVNTICRSVTMVSTAPRSDPLLLSREVMQQYLTVAALHGYLLAPRPPDAIELAVDAQAYGVGGSAGAGVSGVWPLMPPPEDDAGVDALRRAVSRVLSLISNPTEAVAVVSASPRTMAFAGRVGGVAAPGGGGRALPPVTSSAWRTEPISGARYHVEEAGGGVTELLLGAGDMRVTKDNRIGPPTPNPLVPVRPLPPRPIVKHMAFDGTMRYYFLDGAAPATSSRSPDSHTVWREFLTAPNANAAVAKDLGPDWKLLTNPTSFNRPPPYPALPLPVLPPESTCRCAFMLQLLSPRPARADVRQGAHAELWLLSFETAIADLADLGAPGGLAYDVTFNKFGLRVCFLGIAQNLPSYARRFCRRLVRHAGRMEGSAGPALLSTEVLDLAVTRARRLSQASKPRRRQIIRELVGAEPSDAGSEGSNFLQSCGGAVCLAQGDLLPGEAAGLTAELREIFQGYISEYHGDDGPHPLASLRPPVFPDLEEIVYRPMWKPRGASPCSIAGGALISDPCGRVRR